MNTHDLGKLWPLGVCGVAVLAGVAGVLFWFDPSSNGFYPTCLFHQMTGLLCPACGSLRAMHQLLHGNIGTAFQFNPLLVLSLPLIALLSLQWLRGALLGKPLGMALPTKWFWMCLVIGVAFSIWRNVPGSMFARLPG